MSLANSPLAPHPSPLILGWTGTAANIEYLEVLREPLRQLAREFSIELRVIAESDRPFRELGFERDGIATRFVRWSDETEIADLRAFDVGLMPMPDTEWTRPPARRAISKRVHRRRLHRLAYGAVVLVASTRRRLTFQRGAPCRRRSRR